MLSKIKVFANHRIVKNVLIVAGGTAASQFITVAISPVLTRLYDPTALGLLGIFTALAAIFTTISSLTYSHAIALPSENRKAIALLRLSIRINCGFTIFLALIYGLWGNRIGEFFQLQDLGLAIWLLSPIVFLEGIKAPIFQWLIRQKNFKLIGKISVFQSFFTSVLKIVGGIIFANATTLIFATFLTCFVYDAWLIIFINKEISTLDQGVDFDLDSEIRVVAKEYSDFPAFRAPQMFLSAISHGLPMLAFGSLFEPAVAGLYSIGHRVLQFPSSLISGSLGTVILPELAHTARTGGDLQRQVLKSTKFLAVIGIIPFGIVFIFGPQLFSFVFGSNWFLAGTYASWLTLQLYCGFINVPAVQALALTKSQSFLLVWEILTTSGKLLTILIGGLYWHKPEMAVALYSCFGAIAYIVLITFSISRAGNKALIRN